MSDPTRSTVTAGDVMTASPRTCSPFSSVLEAVMIFRDADCGAVPVVDGGVPVGVLTVREVAMASADGDAPLTRLVTDIMSQGAISVTPDTSLEEVREKFAAHAAHYLLVVDVAGQLQGIITASDLAPAATEGMLCAS